MFDIGWGELIVIGIVALIAIGPKELPTVLRTLGQYMAKIKRMSSEFQSQFQEALREAEVADLKKHADDLTSSVSDFTKLDPLADAETVAEHAAEGAGEPASGTTTNENGSVEIAEPVTDGSANAALANANMLPQIDGAPSESLPPVTKEDFGDPSLPSPKPVGGDA